MLQYPLVEKPEHVPDSLVRRFDIYNLQAKNGDWQLAVHEHLHSADTPDIFWTPHNGGHWVVTRAPLVQKILKDYQRFSSRRVTVIPGEDPDSLFAPLQVDPPDHVKYRKLIMPALSPIAVKKLGEQARQLTINLIEGFQDKGECEFIEDFATYLPLAIFMSIVDLPDEDRVYLSDIANTLVRGQDLEQAAEARVKLATYVTCKIQERRANPGNDLISSLTQAKVDGKPIDDNILLGMITLLMIAGLDTVAMMMGFFTNFLARNPGPRQQMIDNPDIIPEAVEEMLRRFPIANTAREAIGDMEFGGIQIRKGDMFMVASAAAGLDDKHYDNPETVDIDRKNKIHETFGDGPHRCIGSMLARVELRIFLEEWLKRIPNFSIRPGAEIEAISRGVAGITSLPLVWDT